MVAIFFSSEVKKVDINCTEFNWIQFVIINLFVAFLDSYMYYAWVKKTWEMSKQWNLNISANITYMVKWIKQGSLNTAT